MITALALAPACAPRYTTAMRIPGLFALAIMLGCASPQPSFNGDRAFADLTRQLEFGPRIPGRRGHSECAKWIEQQLRSHSDAAEVQEFRGTVLGSPDTVTMMNIIARYNPGDKDRIMISAHWDTRPHADLDPDSSLWRNPVPGANDGASGVAVLLELARLLDSLPPPGGVDLVFFDGEDGGDYGSNPGRWCQGSFHFANNLRARYIWAINVDMVGDRDLHLPIEGNSFRLAPELCDRVWTTAAELQEPAFVRVRGHDVFDDHMPLLMKGIPAIDIIDFDYPHWHTTHDTVDKCAPHSLASVGRVLVAMIYSR